jgi:hypothetical protein
MKFTYLFLKFLLSTFTQLLRQQSSVQSAVDAENEEIADPFENIKSFSMYFF